MNIKATFYILTLGLLISCGGREEGLDEAWEEFNEGVEEVEEVEPSGSQTISLFDDKLSYVAPGNFVMVAQDEKPAGNGALVQKLIQYGLEMSDEIVFSCIYQEMEAVGKNTEEFYEMSKNKPRPNTERISIEKVSINGRDWVYEQYETEMQEGIVVVDNFLTIEGAEWFTCQAVCDKPVYENWSGAIEDFKNSLALK